MEVNSYYDIVIIGNGSAGASVVYELNKHFKENPNSNLTVLLLESEPKENIEAIMPEYNARITFPYELIEPIQGIENLIINTYDEVAFYAPGTTVRKELPENSVSLVDINKLINLLETDLSKNIKIKYGKQVFDAEYLGTGKDKQIKLTVGYKFGNEKIFEVTDEIMAKAIVDCSGTGSIIMDKLQGYKFDSEVVCGVLAFKVINAKINTKEVSLALDDRMSHGAGMWSYNNDNKISPELEKYLEHWFLTTTNKKVQGIIKDKSVKDFAGTISDVGLSSIAPYARNQHYINNLERQIEGAFNKFPAYKKMFEGAIVIPNSWFYKASPVLQPVAKMAGDNYILVGDSAGHATPYIGEGIRPGIDMGITAARILIKAISDNDLSEKRLKKEFEDVWMNRYGQYEIYSELFRHFSSTCFTNEEWNTFFEVINDKLTDREFYKVLKSEYNSGIVGKMVLDPRMAKIAKRYFNSCESKFSSIVENLDLRHFLSWFK